jgi:hypothetical protein
MLLQVLHYIKNPVYEEDEVYNLKHRFNVLIKLLALALFISLILGMGIGILESSTTLDLGKHAMDLLLEQYSLWVVFLAGVILAPVLEELVFRGPLIFFRNSRFFPYVFYAITLIFGFYHITNFELSREVLLLSPLLVAPQLCVGIFLGYIRVRFGLLWAMLLHALYNFVLLGPVLLLKSLNISLV